MSFFDRSNTVAKPGFSRWMVPAGRAVRAPVHRPSLRIQRVQPADDQAHRHLEVRAGRLELTELGWIFSIGDILSSASRPPCSAAGSRKADRAAPCSRRRCAGPSASSFRRSASTSTIIWVVYLGYGVFGGIGLGIGYISPVSTLIKWFPDRPGMATGMAIMGFGGGAFIASPLVGLADEAFHDPEPCRRRRDVHRAWASIYFVFMLVGRVDRAHPGAGLEAGRLHRAGQASKLITTNDVYVYDALKTPQFWLIWWVLCLNVTAGIGVLGQASAMSQEMFPGRVTPVAAAGFVGLMSLFNMGGRFFWASTSDYIGRKNTYFVFLVLGFLLYCTVPSPARSAASSLFVLLLPRHHQHVRRRLLHRAGLSEGHVRHPLCRRHPRLADHGVVDGRRLRPGAGQLHPRVQITHGVPKAQAYNVTMYIMAACW